MRSLVGVCVVIASGFMALPASATTYHFSGHLAPIDSGAGNILNYVSRFAPLTFDFTTPSPLAANLVFGVRDLPTFWEASGGSADSTIDSSDTAAVLLRFSFSTNSLGDIVRYNIEARATNAELPGKQWDYIFQNTDPNNVFERVELDTLQFNGVIHYTTLDSALICTNACGNHSPLGSFSIVNAAPGVPEPASWALMIAGFGLAGAQLRRRRKAAAAIA